MLERLFVRNKASWERLINDNYRIEKLPEIFKLNNGIILPCKGTSGGVCDSNFLFKGGLIRTFSDSTGWGNISSGYTVDKSRLKYIDETVVFGGVLIPQFGHMLLDNMSRLWWHLENTDSKLRFVFILNKFEWKDWIWDFFDLLGISRERVLVINEPTQFSEIIVPEEAAHVWESYTDKWECVFELLAKNATECCVGGGNFLKKYIYPRAIIKTGCHIPLMSAITKSGIGNMVMR